MTGDEFLQRIWAPGWHSLCAQGTGDKFWCVGTFNTPEALHATAEPLRATHDLWVGVHGMAVRPEKRGGSDDVTAVLAVQVDLDWQDDAHAKDKLPTEAKVRTELVDLQPTIVVHSGHGLQAYWVLDTPVSADVGKTLINGVHAELEAVGLKPERRDLASVLRLPGSINFKTKPVQVVVESSCGPTWTAEKLAARFPAPTPSRLRAHAPTRLGTGDGPMDRICSELAHRSWDEVLGEFGWTPLTPAGGVGRYQRPGKDRPGVSATTNANGTDRLYVFSEGVDELEHSTKNGTTYDRLDVYANYRFNGDRVAAARAMFPELWPTPTPPAGVDRATGEIIGADLPTTWSDAHVGEKFAEFISGRWLHCRPLGGWFRWDGKRWQLDRGEAVHEEFRQWIIRIGEVVWKSPGSADTMKQIGKYRERGKIDAAVTIARRLDYIAADADEFDRHPNLLNVANGVVDLTDGTLRPHDPALRLTRLAGASYRPDATHADLNTVLEALEPEARPWVQRYFGSAAVGRVVDDVLAVFDGDGANGKTTLLKAVAGCLGEYACPASTRLLMARGVSDEHPTLVADLKGRRLVYIEETPEGGALKMEQVKAITGGGALKARFIGQDYFQFEPSHTLVVATNHRPAVNASDYAAWRRLRLVPFRRTYRLPHEARPGDLIADRGLRPRLDQAAQREAVLAWVVAGAVAWHADGGLGSCPPIDEATTAWRRDEDVIHAWWADCVRLGGNAGAAEVYRSFSNWCISQGRRFVPSNKEFAKRFTEHDLYRQHGISKRSTAAGALYEGLFVVDVVGTPVGSQNHLHEKPFPLPTTPTTSRAYSSAHADVGPF